MNLTEQRRNTLINILYFAVLATVYVLFMKYALGIVLPFIIAFAVAMAMQRPVKFLEKKTRISHKFWAILLVILLML
nr:sporulation integral membrane protein YtvI [Clostridiales bacterium]